MVILTIILVQVLCCHLITKIIRNGINGAMFVSLERVAATGYSGDLLDFLIATAKSYNPTFRMLHTHIQIHPQS